MFLANITPVLKLLFTRAQVKPDKSGKGLSHVIFHGVAVICSHLQQEAEMMRRCVTHQQPQSWGTLPLPALHHFCQLPVITLPASGERCLLDHNKQCLCHMKSFFFFLRLFPSRNTISELMLVSQLWEVRLSSKIHVIHFLLNYLPP